MTVRVVGAAVVRDGRVLAGRRTSPPALAGLWELPGGKVEPGEDDRTAVARECLEELLLVVEVGDQVGPETALPTDAVLVVLACTTTGEPTATEHSELRWLAEHELDQVEWLPGDLPLLPHLASLLNTTRRGTP